MTDLLPCPFCGGEAQIIDGETLFLATCKDLKCGCRLDWWGEKEDAVKAWNTRNQWQPIETAPKDGTWILLYHKHTRISDWYWDGAFWCNDELTWAENDKPPTLWIPIPDPPKGR